MSLLDPWKWKDQWPLNKRLGAWILWLLCSTWLEEQTKHSLRNSFPGLYTHKLYYRVLSKRIIPSPCSPRTFGVGRDNLCHQLEFCMRWEHLRFFRSSSPRCCLQWVCHLYINYNYQDWWNPKSWRQERSPQHCHLELYHRSPTWANTCYPSSSSHFCPYML